MALLGVLALASCATVPDSSGTSAAEACATRIIMKFATPTDVEPDAGLVNDLARVANVHLTFLRSAGAGMQVFALSADDAGPGCGDALERLRHDPRLTSVDIDARRGT